MNLFAYRDLEKMMQERGVEVDHSILNRWGNSICRQICQKSQEAIDKIEDKLPAKIKLTLICPEDLEVKVLALISLMSSITLFGILSPMAKQLKSRSK